ncbi:MAG: hypothetical protein Q7W16_01300 [Coriobacteriia bacterium]|nr:hypothetical protein [Coriobacteriia bacterium]
MARKAFGAASDFYRLRVTRMDDSDSPDLQWRDDILWRRPPTDVPGERELWRVEAVVVDDDENVTTLGVFDDSSDAHEALSAAEEDLAGLTIAQFEERYFPAEV